MANCIREGEIDGCSVLGAFVEGAEADATVGDDVISKGMTEGAVLREGGKVGSISCSGFVVSVVTGTTVGSDVGITVGGKVGPFVVGAAVGVAVNTTVTGDLVGVGVGGNVRPGVGEGVFDIGVTHFQSNSSKFDFSPFGGLVSFL